MGSVKELLYNKDEATKIKPLHDEPSFGVAPIFSFDFYVIQVGP
jgi:hypothetical protein